MTSLSRIATVVEERALWGALPILVAVPIYWPAFGEDSIERMPLMWLLLAGILVVLRVVAGVHPALALFIGYAVAHTGFRWWPRYAMEPLAFLLLAGGLYLVLSKLTPGGERWLGAGLLLGLGLEWALGLVNLFGVYPSLTGPSPTLYINTAFASVGQPMGLLRHPNYWALAMALGAPLAWHRLGWLAGVVMLAPVLYATQMTATVAGLVGLFIMAWPRSHTTRVIAAATMLAAAYAVVVLHGPTTSGRWEMWRDAWPMIAYQPWLGGGLGTWYIDAALQNARLRRAAFMPQAMSEPYQLLYELGVVGVLLGLAVLAWTARDGWRARAHPESRPWAAMLAVAAVSMWGTPTFHLPTSAFCAIVAAARLRAWSREKGCLDAA